MSRITKTMAMAIVSFVLILTLISCGSSTTTRKEVVKVGKTGTSWIKAHGGTWGVSSEDALNHYAEIVDGWNYYDLGDIIYNVDKVVATSGFSGNQDYSIVISTWAINYFDDMAKIFKQKKDISPKLMRYIETEPMKMAGLRNLLFKHANDYGKLMTLAKKVADYYKISKSRGAVFAADKDREEVCSRD